MTVDTYVDLQRPRVVTQRSVGMAVQIPGAAMRLVPGLEGVVAEDDLLAFDRNRFQVLRPDPMLQKVRVLTHSFIVVPENEILVAVQTSGKLLCYFRLRKSEVTEAIDQISRPDHSIPVRDQGLVHFVNVSERATRVGQNVGMTNVEI